MDNANSKQEQFQSMIDKYNCRDFYYTVYDCVAKHMEDNMEDICKQEYRKLGECVLKGMKEQEKADEKKNI